MAISAAQVKELRERTGAGMMECKKALVDTDGDMEGAIEHLRRTGLAKADKKAGRTAAEGRIALATSGEGSGVLVEVNCETDFVAKDENFVKFADAVAALALAEQPADAEALNALKMEDDATVVDAVKALVAKLGENIQVRRLERLEAGDGVLGSYLHGARIGTMVAVQGGDADLARDLAMHVAASKPAYVSADDVPAGVMDKEREILVAQAQDSGKPREIIEKMVEGRLRKHLAEITLLGQPFVKDPDITVEKLLEGKGATVTGLRRLEVGEGVEKKEESFADEVRAQVHGSA